MQVLSESTIFMIMSTIFMGSTIFLSKIFE